MSIDAEMAAGLQAAEEAARHANFPTRNIPAYDPFVMWVQSYDASVDQLLALPVRRDGPAADAIKRGLIREISEAEAYAWNEKILRSDDYGVRSRLCEMLAHQWKWLQRQR